MPRPLLALILILALCPAAWSADWVALIPNSPPGSPPVVRTVASSPARTILDITVPGFWVEEGAAGLRLHLPDGLTSMEEGRPELPFLGCTVAMPLEGTPRLAVLRASWSRPGPLAVRMAPRPEREGELHAPPAPIAPGEPFPAAPALVVHTGLWREVPLATLQIHPFQADGMGLILAAASFLEVEVVHPGAPAVWPAFSVPEGFEPLFEALAVNSARVPVSPSVAPLDAPAPEYLVLGPAALLPGAASLVDWRRETGLATEVVALATTDPAAIKALIQARFALGKLKHVLLVGDYAHIPYYSFSGTSSDMWYACLTGAPDLYPDCGLGRLSGTSSGAIAHQAAKILAYEKTPPAGDWFAKTVLVAHREQAPGKYVGCSEEIANGPLGSSGWSILKQYGHISSVSNATVSAHINAGVGLVNYRGHGSTTTWASGWNTLNEAYAVGNVNALANGAMTPVVFNIACTCGDHKSSCLQEAWLQTAGGAVASLGAILPSYTTPNHAFDKELYRAIFQDGLTNIYSFWYKGVAVLISQGSAGQANAKMYWWGGDAATSMWGKAPLALLASHPDSIPVGAQNVSVTVTQSGVPLSGAKVCLYKDPEVHVSGATGASGSVLLPVDPLGEGSILVTVTAKECRPFQGRITVRKAAAPAEVLYYKFDAGDGGKAINYYSSTGLAPAEATITTTYPGTTAWAPGKFGAGALLGSHYDPANPTVRSSANYVNLDTGWVPNLTGSFSIAWFMKERAPLGTSLGYLFSNNGSFRGFYNGVAYKGFMVRAWGGSPADLTLLDPAQTPNPALPTFDLLAAAAAKWVHVALVVDATAMTATYYIDGVALAPTIALTAPANLAGTTPLLLGRHTSAASSFMHDLDEFRFLLRAATPAEIQAWAARPEAAAGIYGKGCGGTLNAAKPPVVPGAFQMDLTGPALVPGFLSLGLSRTRLGSYVLPLDLGAYVPGLGGCLWESDLTAALPVALDQAGAGVAVLNIPKSSALLGASLYNQALFLSKAGKLSTTNGLALGL